MTAAEETRERFLTALRRASQIKIDCAVAFAGLREVGDRRRELMTEIQTLQDQVRAARNDPASNGNRGHRLAMKRTVAALQRRLEEARAVLAIVESAQVSLQPRAQTLAQQRDATEKLIERMRDESDALIEADVRTEIAADRQQQAAAGIALHPTPSYGG